MAQDVASVAAESPCKAIKRYRSPGKKEKWRSFFSVASRVAKDEAMVCPPGDRGASRWDTPLRFALTTGLRFRTHPNENPRNNEKGTFLKS